MSTPRRRQTPVEPPPAEDEERYSITRRDGFLRFVERPPRAQPPCYTRDQMAALSRGELARWNEARMVWTANIGPIQTPQLTDLKTELSLIVNANRQDGEKQKPAVLVDAYSGLGKTTAVLDFVRDYHREQIELRGAMTADGHRRTPVAYIDLSGNTQIRGLNEALCRFYNLPHHGNADVLAERAKDACRSLDTRVFVVDDLHFLAPATPNKDSARMVNQLKFLANTFPVTLVYVGVDVITRGLHLADNPDPTALSAQFGRRTTPLTMRPFRIDGEEGRTEWRRLLKSIERQLVLADRYKGMLADDLSDYLYARSTGHFQSLMTLIIRGCARAILTGREVLDVELMDKVKNDVDAEQARQELEAKIAQGLIWSRPGLARAR